MKKALFVNRVFLLLLTGWILSMGAIQAQDAVPDQMPEPVNMKEVISSLRYPEAAREESLEGMLIAKVLVDEQGKYVQHEWLKGGDARLEKAVEDAIGKLRFTAAQKDGSPVKCWVSIPFQFRL